MKIITLNTWGGRAGDGIMDFFKKYSDVDIFLLQEVFHNAGSKTVWHDREKRELFREISEVLPTPPLLLKKVRTGMLMALCG